MAKYIMGLDLGTSSIKGVLLRADGTGEAEYGRSPFRYNTTPDGRVEINAEDYLASCFKLMRELSSKLPADGELCAVGNASASGNVLLLGEDGKPITPIFNWQDHRVTDEVDKVLGSDFDTEAYFRSTGWAFSGKTFPLAQLSWLKCHESEKLENCSAVCMSTEYLLKTLTGEWGISTSAGTPFYLIDQKSGTYNKDVLDKFGIPESKLPPVVKVGTVIGKVTEEGSRLSGLPVGTPMIAGTFDHPSAARGTGIIKQGQVLLSCGTSWVGFFPVDSRELLVDNHMLIDPFLSGSGGAWAGMVSLASVASKIDEYVTHFFGEGDGRYKRFEGESKKGESGAGGLVITMTDADDLAEIEKHPKPMIARAIMECVVGMLKKDFDRLAEAGISAKSGVMVGGPSECPFWTNVIEEKTGIHVEIKHGAFAGARGAALVAGIGAGLWCCEAKGLEIIG